MNVLLSSITSYKKTNRLRKEVTISYYVNVIKVVMVIFVSYKVQRFVFDFVLSRN